MQRAVISIAISIVAASALAASSSLNEIDEKNSYGTCRELDSRITQITGGKPVYDVQLDEKNLDQVIAVLAEINQQKSGFDLSAQKNNLDKVENWDDLKNYFALKAGGCTATTSNAAIVLVNTLAKSKLSEGSKAKVLQTLQTTFKDPAGLHFLGLLVSLNVLRKICDIGPNELSNLNCEVVMKDSELAKTKRKQLSDLFASPKLSLIGKVKLEWDTFVHKYVQGTEAPKATDDLSRYCDFDSYKKAVKDELEIVEHLSSEYKKVWRQ